MIGKAATIAHGFNDISYIRGKSANKKHPERIFFVKNNLLDDALDSEGIYDAMKSRCEGHPRMTRKVIRMELCPQAECTKGFTIDDWRRLWDDFIAEFDRQELRDRRTGKITSPKTNLAGSMGTVWLHLESRSGIPHLHGACCRVDEQGGCNDAHNIHIRAKRAAEAVAIKRGWDTADDVRAVRLKEERAACEEALKSMGKWSWNDYAPQLAARGFKLHIRTDGTGKVVGYAVQKCNTRYNASKLGTHTLTAAHIEATWRKLHPQAVQDFTARQAEEQSNKRFSRYGDDSRGRDYTEPRPDSVAYDIHVNGGHQRVYIPKEADDVFKNEFCDGLIVNSAELVEFAVTVFVEVFMHDTGYVPTGGGTSNDQPRRNKDDEDELWARRCARYAIGKIGIVRKMKRRR